MGADSRRLSILTAREIDDLYGLPRFTEDDRLLYFDLSPAERKAVDGVGAPADNRLPCVRASTGVRPGVVGRVEPDIAITR